MITSKNQFPIRFGYSLIELVIVISISVVLLGLILSGVMRVRMSAMKTDCLNTLRNLSQSLQLHCDSLGVFPSGCRSLSLQEKLPYINWQTQVLPYLGEEPTYRVAMKSFSEDRNFFHNPPHTLLARPLKYFQCGSDNRVKQSHIIGLRSPIEVALTSYLGINGWRSSRSNGILYLDSRVALRDITDGTSTTFIVGERPPSADLIWGWWYAGEGQNKDGECDSVLGVRSVNGQMHKGFKNCESGPYHFQNGTISNLCSTFHFWSLHPGGAHFAFADGSVKFLRYSTDPIMPALATRAGGEAVAVPD